MTEPRSIPTYPKIDTYFDRGEDFTVDVTAPQRPEFTAIDRWIFTEKVDGTNIRLDFARRDDGGVTFTIGGRTNNAQLPKPLQTWLEGLSGWLTTYADQIMEDHSLETMTIFGEGYGPKIQKGGGNYRADQSFIVFDVLVNDKNWLDEAGIDETAERFAFDRVPHLMVGTIVDAIRLIREGVIQTYAEVHDDRLFRSRGSGYLRSAISEADFECEGIVARPAVPLYDGRGRRVMWKLKGSDFRAGKR